MAAEMKDRQRMKWRLPMVPSRFFISLPHKCRPKWYADSVRWFGLRSTTATRLSCFGFWMG